jgi:hypothetical protein
MGTIKIPLAMPSMPPNALATTETANSHNMKPLSISVGFASGSRPAGQPGHEADLVAPVIEFLVIDGRVFGGVRSALYQEYRAACTNTEARATVVSADMASRRYGSGPFAVDGLISDAVSNRLRHSKFVALRDDQDVGDAGRELPSTK